MRGAANGNLLSKHRGSTPRIFLELKQATCWVPSPVKSELFRVNSYVRSEKQTQVRKLKETYSQKTFLQNVFQEHFTILWLTGSGGRD